MWASATTIDGLGVGKRFFDVGTGNKRTKGYVGFTNGARWFNLILNEINELDVRSHLRRTDRMRNERDDGRLIDVSPSICLFTVRSLYTVFDITNHTGDFSL